MAKFMFIYLDDVDRDWTDVSPEEMQVQMKKWWDWLGGGQEAGWVVEMGDALQPDVKSVTGDNQIIDGPHPEAKELVGGYSIIEAADFDEACQHARGCPVLEAGGRVEIREIANVEPPE